MQNLFLYIGAALPVFWGVFHFFPTKNVVKGFGDISEDNRRIITMEWVAEGLALAFIGALALLVSLGAGPGDPTAALVIRACAGMLLILAALTFLIGGKTSVIPIKICPLVLTVAAVLLFLGVSL